MAKPSTGEDQPRSQSDGNIVSSPKTSRNSTPCNSNTPSVASGVSTSSMWSPSNDEFMIPDHWRPEIEDGIANKFLTETAKQEMVRSLLFARIKKPNRDHCDAVGRKLIPFVQDAQGTGYVS